MYTINSRILIFILFVYFINISNMNAKGPSNTLEKINTVSKNMRDKIIRKNIYFKKNNKNKIRKKNYLKKNKKRNFFFKYKKIDKIVKEAKSYLGTPYKYGGTSRMGIDCSSFISNIFEINNINLPRLSYKQAKKGLPVSKNELQKGDLLFFSTKFMEKTRINHVGIVIEMKGNNISFIHASSSNGVIISRIKDPYWKPRFIIARRIS